jgi:hypothetical protein
VGELMKAADAECHRLEREELDSVRRGEANSNNRTPKGMRLLKATVLDSIDELAASRALQDDVVEDLRKFLPADLAEDLLTANVSLKKLAGTEGPSIQNESGTLRDERNTERSAVRRMAEIGRREARSCTHGRETGEQYPQCQR